MSARTLKSEYLVLSRGTSWHKILSPEEIERMSAEFTAWFERLSNEGKIKSGHRLAQEGKIVVGRNTVTDGPFVESKEAIGGYWFIRADNLEEAVEIAKGNPCLDYGATVEVRPIVPQAQELQMKQQRRPEVVSRADWLIARKRLLVKEKELTHQRDAVSAERRRLPMVKIDKEYEFDGPRGKERLADLFDGRSQLIVYHFMLGAGWEEGCEGCSFLADHVDGARMHFEHHDVTFVAVSRAPQSEIERFKKRMGWRFKWVSSYGSDFNLDFHVSPTKDEMANGKMYYNYEMVEFLSEEQPGISVFYQDKTGDIFHTYSSYARGGDLLLGAYHYLDLTPLGRQEEKGHGMEWVRHHDRYGALSSLAGQAE
jgi:predicted dithiol-disulfide oxidoreductase (DUF899 family)